MLAQTSDGSIEDHGKVVYFSFDRFMAEIALGNNCFICGTSPNRTPFNDEHVLPDWILRRYSLYDRVIHIPNGTQYRYRNLKIPCCVKCNSLMGKVFETPLRDMFHKGYKAFSEALHEKGSSFLFNWLALIFLKTHLKDKSLRFFRDLRKEGTTIGEIYSWEELHHIHCICRSFYTGCKLDVTVRGSLLVLPAKTSSHFERFDYFDLHLSQTMLLRIDDIALIVTLNDGRAGLAFLKKTLDKISGPLSPIQLREIAVRLASFNIHLEERPRFFSDIDPITGDCRIMGRLPPTFSVPGLDDALFGNMFYFTCKNMLSFVDDPTIIEHVKNGKWTFLLDGEGNFIENSMELRPEGN